MSKLLSPTSLLLVERLFRIAAGFYINTLVVKYLGPADFGLWSFAIAIVTLFSFFPTLNLEPLLIRGLTQKTASAESLLGTALTLKATGAVLGIVAIALYVALFEGFSSPAVPYIFLVALTFIIQPLDLFESYFQAEEKVHWVVLARFISFCSGGIAKIVALLNGMGLTTFILINWFELLFGILLTGVGYVIHSKVLRWKFERTLASPLLREAYPLVLSSIAVLLYTRLDQIMLGKMIDEAEVGTYAVAVKLTEIWYFIPVSLAGILMQKISHAFREKGPKVYSEVVFIYSTFFWLSIALSVSMTILSPVLIHILYGSRFLPAVIPSQIYVWTLTASFIGVASSQYMVLLGRSKELLYRTLLGLVLNFFLNLVLIPRYAGTGAAIATFVSYNAAAFSIFFPRRETEHRGLLLSAMTFGSLNAALRRLRISRY